MAHVFRVPGKHDIETEADPRLPAAVGVDRVRQPGRKDEKRAVYDTDDDLIRVLGGKFRYRRTYDAGLGPRIVEVYRIGAVLGLHVVDAAQEIVRVAVHPVGRAGRTHVGPKGRPPVTAANNDRATGEFLRRQSGEELS